MPLRTQRMPPGLAERSSKMYILPTPTHLEVVALGDSSDISPDQHLNYASDVRTRRTTNLGWRRPGRGRRRRGPGPFAHHPRAAARRLSEPVRPARATPRHTYYHWYYLRGDPKEPAPEGQHKTAPNAHLTAPWPMGLGWGVSGDNLCATFMPRLCVYGR